MEHSWPGPWGLLQEKRILVWKLLQTRRSVVEWCCTSLYGILVLECVAVLEKVSVLYSTNAWQFRQLQKHFCYPNSRFSAPTSIPSANCRIKEKRKKKDGWLAVIKEALTLWSKAGVASPEWPKIQRLILVVLWPASLLTGGKEALCLAVSMKGRRDRNVEKEWRLMRTREEGKSGEGWGGEGWEDSGLRKQGQKQKQWLQLPQGKMRTERQTLTVDESNFSGC